MGVGISLGWPNRIYPKNRPPPCFGNARISTAPGPATPPKRKRFILKYIGFCNVGSGAPQTEHLLWEKEQLIKQPLFSIAGFQIEMLSCQPTVTRAPDDRQPLRSIIFFSSCIIGVSRESISEKRPTAFSLSKTCQNKCRFIAFVSLSNPVKINMALCPILSKQIWINSRVRVSKSWCTQAAFFASRLLSRSRPGP